MLWNREFSEGRWNFIEKTPGDVVYAYVEKYCRHGSILDLGCGSGNTGCELDRDSYEDYVGVDISDVAVQKAKRRSKRSGRWQKNSYFQGDIAAFRPKKQVDVILFRESIYYIPRSRISAVLERYAGYLKAGGVEIVRWHEAKGAEGPA